MMSIIKRNLALVCMLTFWSSGVIAAECKTDVSACTMIELCNAATTIKRGHLEWDFDSLDHVASAKNYGLNCGVDNLAKKTDDQVDVQVKFTKNDFTVFNQLERHQIQYALKRLGYYSSGVDGLWGKGTERAVNKFIRDEDIKTDLATNVYKSLTLAVDVTNVALKKTKISTPRKSKSGKNKTLCKLNKNSVFERMLVTEGFIPRAVKQLNSLREIEVVDDVFLFGSKKIKPDEDGAYTRYIHVRCVDNVNNWSRCGTFLARAILRVRGSDTIKGKLLLPSEWPLYTGQQQELEYTCSKK